MKTKEAYHFMRDTVQTYFQHKKYSFVLLFGSYNSNTFSEHSDIDIGIYFPDKINYMDLGYDVAQLEAMLHKRVDIIALNGIYKKDSLFAFNILGNHSTLLVNYKKTYIDFKTSSQLYYLDRKELIEMNHLALQNRIKNHTIGERNFVGKN